MLSFGFTGTRTVPKDKRILVYQAVDALPRICRVVTGACIGVDAIVARFAWGSGRQVHTIVPADRSRVSPDWRDYCHTFEEMPPGTTYKDRNERIVAEGQHGLIAIAEAAEDAPQSRRSGTWQTVRIGRRAGRDVTLYILDE